MTLPNFIIAGTMKSATSTVRNLLEAHPDVWIARPELRFFVDPNFARGLDWYAEQFAQAGDARAVGEKSPVYAYTRGTAERIARSLPGVRIVFLLREPVARTYSNYWFRVSGGRERRTFRSAIDLELAGRLPETAQILRRSRYAEQVAPYLQAFPPDRIHFMLIERFRENPRREFGALCRFLGVRDDLPVDTERRSNPTRIPRSRHLAWLAARIDSPGLARVVAAVNEREVGGYPPISESMRTRLADYFAPFNAELARSTGLDLGVWNRSAPTGTPATTS